MRTIKFRAWDKKEKQMHNVAGMGWNEKDNELVYVDIAQTSNVDQWYAASDYELMQFTGLKDKNGKEIYEGDIVEVVSTNLDGAKFAGKAKIVWAEVPPEFCDEPLDEDKWIQDWNLADDYSRMEIIGNIYENPELIK